MLHLIAATIVLGLAGAAAAQQNAAYPDVDLRGRLYRSVFQTAPPYLSSGDIADLPASLRERLSAYLTRRAAFTSRYEGAATGFESAMSDAKRRALERAIVSIVDDSRAQEIALAFLKEAPVAAEWRTVSDPAKEAGFAESYLQRNASSPLAPFLHLFIAHRQRAAFELAYREKDGEAQTAAARKYRTFVARARAAKDPIYGLIADDLDRQAYVHVPAAAHPRDFGPGG
jgi:hypothetical protein